MAIKNTLHLPIRRPQPLGDKFYVFHQEFKHDTKSCRELQDFIKDLICRNYMKQFVAREGKVCSEPLWDKRERERERSLEHRRVRESKGDQYRGDRGNSDDQRGPTDKDSTNTKKENLKRTRHKVLSGYLRPEEEQFFTVAFSLVERKDLVEPFADLLVITTLVSSFETRRITIDTGSSVDV